MESEKLSIVDLANMIGSGEVPPAEVLVASLEHAKALMADLQGRPLDDAGKKLAADLMRLIDSIEKLAEKNKDQHLEKFLEHGRIAAAEIKKSLEGVDLNVVGGVRELQKTIEDIRSVMVELVSSSDFRDLAAELLRALHRIVTPLAEQATEKAKELGTAGVEKAKELGAAAVEKGKAAAAKAGEAMDIDVPKPRGRRGRRGKKRTGGEALVEAAAEYVPLSPENLKALQDQLTTVLRRMAGNVRYKNAIKSIFNIIEDVRPFSKSWMSEFEPVKEKATEIKEKGQRATKKAKQIADEKAEEAKEKMEEVREKVQEALENEHLSAMWKEAKTFIEKFSGDGKVDALVDDIMELWEDISVEPDLGRVFSDFKSFVLDTLQDPSRLGEKEHLERMTVLLEPSRKLLHTLKAAPTVGKIVWDSMDLVNRIKNDPGISGLSEATKALMQDLLLDKEGHVAFKPELLTQIRGLVVQALIAELKHIPIGKVEGSTDSYDYRVEDLALSGHDLLPEHIHVKIENDMSFNIGELTTERAKANVTIKATNIKTHMENVKFWFRRRGLVNVEDEGVAAVMLKGEGAEVTLQIKFDANRGPGEPLFRVKNVECELPDLHIHVLESKYDWLINFLSPLFSGSIRTMLQEAVEVGVRRGAEDLERQLSSMVERASPEKLAPLKERLSSAVVGQAASLGMRITAGSTGSSTS
jgi:molecular chaperone GrpE (heat shock protein)